MITEKLSCILDLVLVKFLDSCFNQEIVLHIAVIKNKSLAYFSFFLFSEKGTFELLFFYGTDYLEY